MYNILRLLFLFFFYFSNASTVLSIYPISYYLIENTTSYYKWYYLGLIFSLYELGKFSGIPLWDCLYKKHSNLILVLISLLCLGILNISFSFVTKLYQILILRFLFGFFNITGVYFRDIYIQIGFKKNIKIIILIISIISTSISLFFPTLIIHFNIGEKLINIKLIYLKNIMIIYLCLSMSNLLPIILCYALICKNKLKVEQKFYPIHNIEKTENSVEKSLGSQKNNFIETEQKSHSKVVKVNQISDSNIQFSMQKNPNNENETRSNKERKYSENKNFNNLEKKENDGGSMNIEQINNINNTFNIKDNISENKEYQLCSIQTFLNMVDSLSLIWALIILYNQYKRECLYISIYVSLLKLLGEILLFPINEKIMKNLSSLIPLDFISICQKMKKIIIISLILSICLSLNIFFIYYYSDYIDLLLIILFIILLAKTVFSGIFTQYYKIYINLYFKQNNLTNKKLKKYNQYFGSLGKSIIYIIGAFGLYMIELLYRHKNKRGIVLSTLYFQTIPILIYIILFVTCSKYIN